MIFLIFFGQTCSMHEDHPTCPKITSLYKSGLKLQQRQLASSKKHFITSMPFRTALLLSWYVLSVSSMWHAIESNTIPLSAWFELKMAKLTINETHCF